QVIGQTERPDRARRSVWSPRQSYRATPSSSPRSSAEAVGAREACIAGSGVERPSRKGEVVGSIPTGGIGRGSAFVNICLCRIQENFLNSSRKVHPPSVRPQKLPSAAGENRSRTRQISVLSRRLTWRLAWANSRLLFDPLAMPGRASGLSFPRSSWMRRDGARTLSATYLSRSGSVTLMRSSATDELSIGQRVGLDQLEDRVPEQVGVRPVVPAERSLIQIGRQMLHRELVVGADHGAVEQAPHALDRVRVNLPAHPFVAGVIDPLVFRVLVGDAS